MNSYGYKRVNKLKVGDVIEIRDAYPYPGRREWRGWSRAIVVAPWHEDENGFELTLAAYDADRDSVYVYGVYDFRDRNTKSMRLAICSGAHHVQLRLVDYLDLDDASLETLVALAPGFAGTLEDLVTASSLLNTDTPAAAIVVQVRYLIDAALSDAVRRNVEARANAKARCDWDDTVDRLETEGAIYALRTLRSAIDSKVLV